MPTNNEIYEQMQTEKQVQEQLKKMFAGMSKEIQLILFTDPVKNETNNSMTRQVIRLIREVAPNIKLREFNLDHALAKQYGITESPTLLIDPDHYNIRWLGAPVGEESRSFIEALIMVGFDTAKLGQESSKVLQSITEKRDVKVFTSPTCPYCPQQALNGLKAAIARPDLVSLSIIDIQAMPDLAEKYEAFSVPQTMANETLIAKGAQPEELFMLSLKTMAQETIFIPENDAEEVACDLVIIGGGPAGLSAGIYAARSGLKTVIIERNMLGGQIAITPIVENYPGLTQVGGKKLVEIMVSHALEYVTIFPGEEVIEIVPGEPLTIKTTRRKLTAKALLLATGASHKILGVEGEQRLSGSGVSYCSTCDGPLFKGKKVFMVGGGNSAVTEALHLKNIGVDVTLIHRRDTLRAQDHLVKSLKDNDIPILFDTQICEIKGAKRVEALEVKNSKTGTISELNADGIFIAIGYEPAVELARKTGIELTREGYIKHDAHHRTNIRGIYTAGDVEGGYKQIVIAAGQGAAAAMSIFEDIVNPYWKES